MVGTSNSIPGQIRSTGIVTVLLATALASYISKGIARVFDR